MNIFSMIGQIFKPAMDMIDNVHTSTEEKLSKKAELLALQVTLLDQGLAYELAQLEARTKVIEAEAKSEHWIVSSWRPITMLTFVGLLVATWTGLTADINLELQLELMSIVKIGLGGYVVGRSAEKIAVPLVKAMKDKEQT